MLLPLIMAAALAGSPASAGRDARAQSTVSAGIVAGAFMGGMFGVTGGFGIAFGTYAACGDTSSLSCGEAAGSWMMAAPILGVAGAVTGAALGAVLAGLNDEQRRAPPRDQGAE